MLISTLISLGQAQRVNSGSGMYSYCLLIFQKPHSHFRMIDFWLFSYSEFNGCLAEYISVVLVQSEIAQVYLTNLRGFCLMFN